MGIQIIVYKHQKICYNIIMKKILIVGQNPSAQKPRKNSTFDRLDQWCKEMKVNDFDFINCIDSVGDYKKLNINKTNIVNSTRNRKKIIALGNFSSETLTKLGIDHFKMPHPSPRNRKLNDKEFEKKMINECKSYLNKTCELL